MKAARYRDYLLAVLAITYAFNLTDLWAMGMALQNIKDELHLTDTELGFAGGFAFFVFYSAFGLPLGRWADRGNRVTILSSTRILWAALVVLTGRARSFLQLLVIRMGVAVGESGCMPPAYSLISDYYSRQERPHALGLFFLSVPLSNLLGYFAAGWLIQLYGWRTMFTIIGFPGLALALLVWFTLKETRTEGSRRERDAAAAHLVTGSAAPAAVSRPLTQVLRGLYGNVTYRNLLLTLVVNYLFSSGMTQWTPAFFTRSFGLNSSVLGLWLAVVYGVTGMLGTFLGGYVASRCAGGNERLQLVAVALLNCVPGFLFPFMYLTPNYLVAFGVLGLTNMAFGLVNGPLFASLQTVVPSQSRGMSITILFFFANLIGSGLGPLIAGGLSDYLRPELGKDSLRYALLAMCPWFLWAGWHAWCASKSVSQDIEAAKKEESYGTLEPLHGDS